MVVLASISLHAQYFTVFGVDTTNFPRMRARFVALDAAGNEYRNFSNNEFDFRENGVPYNASLTIACKDTSIPPAANVVLILDRSGSMSTIVDTATKETRMDWVISGATSFLNTFKFIPPSQVACISFGTLPTYESPFRNTAPPLISQIQKLKPQGGTDYNPPMLDTSFGAVKLLAGQQPGVRRLVIFLTDGQPDHPPLTDSIIKLCNQQSIQFYAITIGTQMNNDLATIAKNTGGKAFEAKSKDDLVAIYKLIALETEIKQNCFFEWTAPYSCNQSGRIRNLAVTFKRPASPITSTPSYLAPTNSVANIGVSSTNLYFGDPAPGNSTTRTVTIKATNAPLIVSALNPVPTGFFTVVSYRGGKALPDTIRLGDSAVVTLQFTQLGSKAYRQASLVVSGYPCPPTVSLFGGLSNVQVVYPNDTLKFSTCDTIPIQWAGVEPTQGVNIFYATDGDVAKPNWQLIKQNATGLVYKWVPPVAGKKYRIRITASPAPTYLWARGFGSPFIDTCRSIALDQSQFYVNIAGVMSDTCKVSSSAKTFPSYGGKDAFVARFDSDGNLIWVQNAGGTGDDGAASVVCDNSDGTYVAGYFTSKSIQFGSTQLSLPPFDAVNMFIARYDGSGNATWVRTGGGTSTSMGYAYADSLAYDNDSLYVFGHYKGKMRINGYPASPGYLELSHSATGTTVYKFIASFDKNGNIASLVEGYRAHNYSDSVVSDKNGNVYDAGYFKGTQNNGAVDTRLTSRGDWDCFVRKFGGQPGSSDSSDQVFTVSAPKLSFKSTTIVCPTTSVGQSSDTTYVYELCNTGDIFIQIPDSAFTISGPNKEDFKITSNYSQRILYPGECVNIEIHFQPQSDDGTRTATLTIKGKCSATASIELSGVALPPCRFDAASPYIGAQSVNLSKTVSEGCLIRNMGTQDYQCSVSLIGLNPDEFQLVIKSPISATLTNVNGPIPFTLKKTECLNVDIVFTPKGSGARSALLKFDIPFECGSVQQINLVGNGIAPKLTIAPIDFKLHRVQTTTKLACVISNPDTLDAQITAIDLATKPDANYNLDLTSVSLPYALNKGGTLNVDVLFNPQAQGPFGNYVTVLTAGNSTPFQGEVKGEGFIPQILSYDIDFPASPVGQAVHKNMVIRNTHPKAPLVLHRYSQPDNAAFAVAASGTDVTINPLDSLVVDVTLTPVAGANVGHITLTSDAAPGPNDNPSVDTVITLRGEGLKVDIDPEAASFGDVLACDTIETRTMKITNNGLNPITVYLSQGGDVDGFVVTPTPDSVVLASGASQTYTIRCRALANQKTMTLEFTLPSGKITRTFSSKGITATLNISSGPTPFQVNSRANYPIDITAPTLPNVAITHLEFVIKLDSTSVLFDTVRFKQLYAAPVNGWTWTYTLSSANGGTVHIIGNNATGFSGGKLTYNLPLWLLQVYVASIPVNVSWVNSADYPCLIPSITQGSIVAKVACFASGSRIEINSTEFQVAIAPNPVSGSTLTVAYNIGLDVPYTLELFNTVGERVMLLGDGEAKVGRYEQDVDISSLSNGMYYVRLIAGPYSETKAISISK